MAGFLIAVQMLLNGQLFEIVRFKNRLPGNSFGYRDLMMSLKLAGSEHVCELQLHLQQILDIKPGPPNFLKDPSHTQRPKLFIRHPCF